MLSVFILISEGLAHFIKQIIKADIFPLDNPSDFHAPFIILALSAFICVQRHVHNVIYKSPCIFSLANVEQL